jgi:hypothetical protein
MREERPDDATLTYNRRDAVVVVQRAEGRRMPMGVLWDHEERGKPRIITKPELSVALKASRPHTHTPLPNMSPRAALVEEFDDDTDLPLPSQSLPHTGSRGAIIEEIADSDDGGVDSDDPPELLDHSTSGGPALKPDTREGRVTDITPYKKCAIFCSPK